MFGLPQILHKIRALLRKRRFETEMDDELLFHLERLTEENIRAGMAPDEARRAARLRFGGVDQIKEECRDTRPVRILGETLQDLRYGVRTLAKSPGFAAVSILTLALGIGANTAVFSLIDAILLKNLPVRNPEELVMVAAYHGEKGRDFSYPMFRDIAGCQEVFSGIYATGGAEFVRVNAEGLGELPAETIQGRFVSSDYFSVLGVNPVRGRAFSTENREEAVIGYAFWQTYFGGDPSILGRALTLNQASFAIVGVAPRKFFGESPGVVVDLWIPISSQPRIEARDLLEVRTASWFRTVGRLKPGIDARQAESRLTLLYRQLLADEIASGTGSLIHKAPRLEDTRVALSSGSRGSSWYRQQLSQPLKVLMLVVAVVLLIACSNVANLLLARASFRQKEIGIRLALGAGRLRLVRQLLTESFLLAILGGAAGFGLFFATRQVLLRMASVQLDLRTDWRILGFVLAAAMATGLLFGLAPALRATRTRLVPAIQPDAGRRPRLLVPRLLVVGQMALSLVLLVGAGLLLRTLQNFRDFDAGFVRDKVLLLELSQEKESPGKPDTLGRQILDRMNGLPGVRSASLCRHGFFGGGANTTPIRVPSSRVNPDTDGEIRTERVSPRYFETLGMRLLTGRDFNPADKAVSIINETMARHYFGRENPLGKLLYFPRIDSQRRYVPFSVNLEQEQGVQIIGVVKDARYDDLRQSTPRMAYLPWADQPSFDSWVVVRTFGNPSGLVTPIRRILAEFDPELVLRRADTLENQVNATLNYERLVSELLGFFGSIALLLVCVGLYGLMAYSVGQRTHEIGIRMALGARRLQALVLILRDSVILTLLGVAVGIPVALVATRLVEHFLFGVKPFDPPTVISAVAILVTVSVLAAWLPAQRASRIDPASALREE